MFYPKFLKHWPKIKFYSKVLSYGKKIKTELKQMNWYNFEKIVKGHIQKLTKTQMENAMNYYQK